MTDRDLRQAFLSLREEFLEITHGRIGVIEQNRAVIISGAGVEDYFAALHLVKLEAHTVAGASGTYGYADVYESARALETVCEKLLEMNSRASDGGHLEEFETAVDRLLADSSSMFADPEIGIIPF